jgi:4-oxalocrotonate tautomerase
MTHIAIQEQLDGKMVDWLEKVSDEQQKARLAEEITKDVMNVLNYGEESVSVAIEELRPQDWTEKVYKPDILNHPELYKNPGYNPFE